MSLGMGGSGPFLPTLPVPFRTPTPGNRNNTQRGFEQRKH